MSILSELSQLAGLNQLLAGGGVLEGSFRGVKFYIPSVSHEVGRRVIKTVFPGRDLNQFEDLGDHQGPIAVSGIIVGGDYVYQAKRLEQAFRTAGAGSLTHPWLGTMRVVLSQPVQIRFDDKKLRMASFDAQFERITVNEEPDANSLASLLGAVSALKFQADGLINEAMRIAQAPALLLNTVSGALNTIKGVWSRLSRLTSGGSTIGAAIADALDILSVLSNTAGAMDLRSAFRGPSAALADAATPKPLSMIAPGPKGAPLSNAPGAVSSFNALLDVADGFDQADNPSANPVGAALLLSAEAYCLGDAAALAADCDWTNQTEALSARDSLRDRINLAQDKAAVLAIDLPGPAGALWRGLATLKASVALDFSERLGRLPAVRIIAPNGTLPAFVIAQMLVGDNPSAVIGVVDDLINRNRIKHGGAVPPEPLEVQL